ncbi:unnamed protein product [Phyllotreta striolata]|uniref:Vacuolar ATPase assembly integral membrane protein VMA21 homolog n=1 Tax=Phyllotreta striolata TaxID=444603 RepID=A0A9N9TLJ5_PHYSR|nr:unnamed protein product [Phyllotreta striolata]
MNKSEKQNKIMDPSPLSIFKTILVYSVFILVSPIVTFFVTKLILFEGIFNVSLLTSNICSAIFSVVVLHVAVGMYIYRAYSEAEKVKEQ